MISRTKDVRSSACGSEWGSGPFRGISRLRVGHLAPETRPGRFSCPRLPLTQPVGQLTAEHRSNALRNCQSSDLAPKLFFTPVVNFLLILYPSDKQVSRLQRTNPVRPKLT